MGAQFVESFYFAVPHPRLLLGSRGRPIGRSPASASQSSSLTDSAIFQSALIFCRKCDWSWVSTLVLDWHEGEGSQILMSTMQAKRFVSSPVSACVCATWRTSFLISARRSAKVKFCHENPAFWHLTHLTAFCKTKQLVLGLISSPLLLLLLPLEYPPQFQPGIWRHLVQNHFAILLLGGYMFCHSGVLVLQGCRAPISMGFPEAKRIC